MRKSRFTDSQILGFLNAAQREGLCMESQTCVPYLSRTRAQPTNQARQARSTERDNSH